MFLTSVFSFTRLVRSMPYTFLFKKYYQRKQMKISRLQGWIEKFLRSRAVNPRVRNPSLLHRHNNVHLVGKNLLKVVIGVIVTLSIISFILVRISFQLENCGEISTRKRPRGNGEDWTISGNWFAKRWVVSCSPNLLVVARGRRRPQITAEKNYAVQRWDKQHKILQTLTWNLNF